MSFLERESVFLVRGEEDAVNDDVIELVIRPHRRFIERIFRLADFLGIKIPIVRRDLEFAFLLIDNLLLLGRFAFGVCDRRRREIAQQFVDRRHIMRRLVLELIRRPIMVA